MNTSDTLNAGTASEQTQSSRGHLDNLLSSWVQAHPFQDPEYPPSL